MNPRFDTPPGGDFARYVEQLTATGLPPEDGQPSSGAVSPGQGNRSPTRGRGGQALSAAQRAAATPEQARRKLWSLIKWPLFGYIGLEILSAFVPQLQPLTGAAMLALIAWVVWRAWSARAVLLPAQLQQAAQQLAEEIRKQQEQKRRG